MAIPSNPPAVIFVNNDLTASIQNTLIRQLRIDYVFDGYTFDQIVEADPNWVHNVKVMNSRVMVVRSFLEHQNRDYADVVAFVAHGLITTEKNKFGPPVYSFPVASIHWGQFGIYIKENSHGGCCGSCEPCNPCGCSSCSCGCKCSCRCLVPVSPRGV